MSSKGLDSLQISNALGRLISKKNAAMAGVCARDEVGRALNSATYPLCLVINTDISSGDGEHWVALYLESASRCEFFDSYGERPSYYKIHLPCHSLSLANTCQLQSQLSSVCGHYCLFYLTYRSRGVSPHAMFHCLSPRSLRANDTSIRSALIKLLKRRSRSSSTQLPHPCFTCSKQSCKPRCFIVQ